MTSLTTIGKSSEVSTLAGRVIWSPIKRGFVVAEQARMRAFAKKARPQVFPGKIMLSRAI
jgi:hypothetical protein